MTEPHDRFENAPPPIGWVPQSRACPFCDVPAMHCGCPEGERIIEAHIILGQE